MTAGSALDRAHLAQRHGVLAPHSVGYRIELLGQLAGLEQNSSPNIAQTCYVCCKYVTIILEPTDKSIRYGCSKS
jgi:hypothetical protein